MSKLANFTTSLPRASIQKAENLPSKLISQPPAANGCLEKLRDCLNRVFQTIANFFARIFCAGSKKQEIPQNFSPPSLPKLEDNKKPSAKAKIDNPPVSQAKSLSIPEQNIQKKPTQAPTSLHDESTPSIPRKKPVAQPIIFDRTLLISKRSLAQDESSSVEAELPKRALPITSPIIVASQAADDTPAPLRIQMIPRWVSQVDQTPILATSTKNLSVAEQSTQKKPPVLASFHVSSVPIKKDETQPKPAIAERTPSVSNSPIAKDASAQLKVIPRQVSQPKPNPFEKIPDVLVRQTHEFLSLSELSVLARVNKRMNNITKPNLDKKTQELIQATNLMFSRSVDEGADITREKTHAHEYSKHLKIATLVVKKKKAPFFTKEELTNRYDEFCKILQKATFTHINQVLYYEDKAVTLLIHAIDQIQDPVRRLQIVLMLLERGADPRVKGKRFIVNFGWERDALKAARETGDENLIAVITEALKKYESS
jgi:hypothetical protein